DRVVRMEIKPQLQGDHIRQALVVLSDVTADIERERAEWMGRDLLCIVEGLSRDKAGFLELLADAQQLVQSVERGLRGLPASLADERFLRDLHTLKGNAASVGLVNIAARCHDVEEQLAAGAETAAVGDDLLSSWRELHGKMRSIV